jgi:hypothetical protein
MFLFKKKTIVVDAFVHEAAIHDLFPIEETSNFLPQWFKKIPPSIVEQTPNSISKEFSTIRHCEGFNALYKTGFVIPLWSDLTFETEKDGYSWNMSALPEKATISSHPHSQSGNVFNNYMHAKIESPWILEEKTGIQFNWNYPIWNDVSNHFDVCILPGILNFKYQNCTHINMFLPKRKNTIKFNAGSPIVHLVPISENKVDIRCHLISNEEYSQKHRKMRYNFTSLAKYKKIKNIIDNKSEKKCPFNFK